MKSSDRVMEVSLDKCLGVPIYESDCGNPVMVLFVPVRVDYDETYDEAVARAGRIADALTVPRSKREAALSQST